MAPLTGHWDGRGSSDAKLSWRDCVAFAAHLSQDVGEVFLEDAKVVDGRYPVVPDACNEQTYALSNEMKGPAGTLCGPAHGQRPVDGDENLHG
jgi:hypothetical protein